MVRETGIARTGLLTMSVALLLAGCGQHHGRPPVSASPPRTTVAPAPTTQIPSYPAPVRASEAIWNLRAGLNVAALSCRGHEGPFITSAYGTMLSRHRSLLAAAYQSELQQSSRSDFDRQQTRLYNRFANQRSPKGFCDTALVLARQVSAMDSETLAPAAPRMLAALEAQLR